MTPNQPGADGIEEVESLDAEDEPIDDAVRSPSSSRTTTRCGATPSPATSPTPGSRSSARPPTGSRRSAGSRPPAPTSSSSTSTCRACTASRYARSSPPRTCPPRSSSSRSSGERQDVLDAVKAGASGYLVKSAAREEFLEAVRRTARGRAVFTPGLAGLVLGEFRRMQNAGSGASRRTAAHRARDRGPQARRDRDELQGHRRASSSSRTAPCRTTCRTPSASSRCTTASSWSATRSPRACTATERGTSWLQ